MKLKSLAQINFIPKDKQNKVKGGNSNIIIADIIGD